MPQAWAALLPAGGDLALATFGVADDQYGRPWPAAGSVPRTRTASVGDLLTTADATYLLTSDGAVRLDPFARALYDALDHPGAPPRRIAVAQGPATGLSRSGDLPGAAWPSDVATASPPVTSCLRLDGDTVDLADDPDVAAATGVVVAPGRGALVRTDDGGPVLVDDRGLAFPVGTEHDELRRLGYAGVAARVVPAAWLALLPRGPALTADAALSGGADRGTSGGG